MSEATIRGMDHIGITVPDIKEATTFLCAALGAELLYESVSPGQEIDQDAQQHTLRLADGTQVKAVRMLKLHNGPGIELFEMQGPDQDRPPRASDYGLQHFAVYTDDIEQATQRFKEAGGKMFTEPKPLTFPTEYGDGNQFCYGSTPWGGIIEFISRPTPMPYEKDTASRRWKP